MKIQVAKNKKLITRERALRIAAKRLPKAKKEDLQNIELKLCYKKIYFYKVLALAARTPFPPKKVPYTLFWDSVSNQGGLTGSIPEAQEQEVAPEAVLPAKYPAEELEKQKEALAEKHIMRAYLMKRPELQYKGVEELYLPYWVCFFGENRELFINAATGRINI